MAWIIQGNKRLKESILEFQVKESLLIKKKKYRSDFFNFVQYGASIERSYFFLCVCVCVYAMCACIDGKVIKCKIWILQFQECRHSSIVFSLIFLIKWTMRRASPLWSSERDWVHIFWKISMKIALASKK